MSFENDFTDPILIDKGGYGDVLKAKDKNSGQYYAIKKIEIKNNKDVKEIEIMTDLNTDYVVKCVKYWFEEKIVDNSPVPYLYIQMELCDQNLDTLIPSLNSIDNTFKTFKYLIRSELFVELIECLNYLHTLEPPVIHRDINPRNVLITNGSTGRFLKLCDFGLSKYFENSFNTQGMGSFRYMAPEVTQIDSNSGKSRYNLKSDIYSLGVMATELFDINANIIKIRNLEAMDICLTDYLNTILEQKFRNLFKMISQMVSKEAKGRPENCGNLLSEIKKWTLNEQNLRDDIDFNHFIKFAEKPENIFFKTVFETKLFEISK